MPHNIIRRVMRFSPVLPLQQQTCHYAPDRCDDGEVAGKLGRGPNVISKIDTWYSQEYHIGVQQNNTLSNEM